MFYDIFLLSIIHLELPVGSIQHLSKVWLEHLPLKLDPLSGIKLYHIN